MPDEKISRKTAEQKTSTEAPAPALRPSPPPRTIVSETHGSDGSYEIVYSDGSVEAGSGSR
jgi:hypothetical protein